ncbi:hypothetical protein A0256_23135 [Mucilaginibacter sp. PAMC 26640]|nr:hypothetical protein A0256_23135 [Mucilaginibacter sp. PAMC 26640]
MKDCFDITIDVRAMLNVTSVTSLLGTGGAIFQTERPSGRVAFTDVVINALGITNETIQRGSGNINIYAPAITSGTAKLADQVKLMNISRAVMPLVDAQYKPTFQTWIEDSSTIMQDTDGSYFLNMPFKYQSIQDNFKNI